jgi:hypothetical protein
VSALGVALVAYVAAGVVGFPFLAASSPIVDPEWWAEHRATARRLAIEQRRGFVWAWSAFLAGIAIGACLVVVGWPAVLYVRFSEDSQ